MIDQPGFGSRPLPKRQGEPPKTTKQNPRPHKQLDQTAPAFLQEELFRRIAAWEGVSVGKSLVSVPDARAFHLAPEMARGPKKAFQAGAEFAHLHPVHDGSLHVALPPALYREVQEKGWGEPHPVSGTMMIWGPRDEGELNIVLGLVRASYEYARGFEPAAETTTALASSPGA